MEQYIPKSVLVTEIEKRLSLLKNGTGDSEVMKRVEGVIKGYKSILSFLDTLEVKEVDLEKEIESYYFHQCDLSWCKDLYSLTYIRDTLSKIAKYFFELGLKVQK